MTRRMIHDELFANIDLGECPIETRLLYIGMIVHADDQGRMRADVRYLRAKIFPFDNLADDICLTWRNQLATKGLILIYDVGQKTYLQHPKWDRWQTLRKDRIRSSDCPSPSVDAATKWQPPDNLVADMRVTNDGIREVKRSEVKRSEDKTTTYAEAPKTEPSAIPPLVKPYKVPEKTTDPAGNAVIWYKLLKLVPKDDRAWDKVHFARTKRSTLQLLGICGSRDLMLDCMDQLAAKFTKAGLDWTIETILKHAHEWKRNRGIMLKWITARTFLAINNPSLASTQKIKEVEDSLPQGRRLQGFEVCRLLGIKPLPLLESEIAAMEDLLEKYRWILWEEKKKEIKPLYAKFYADDWDFVRAAIDAWIEDHLYAWFDYASKHYKKPDYVATGESARPRADLE